eukprot:318803_1
MNEIKNGDKIYIFNDFNINDQYVINKDVQIIGISNNKLINCYIDFEVYIKNKSKVFFENIKFNMGLDIESDGEGKIVIGNKCRLWINNSIFEYVYHAIYGWESIETNIVITNCDFYGRGKYGVEPESAIFVGCAGNLNVTDCMFVNCTEWRDEDSDEFVITFKQNISKIKCIGNKFIDNYGCPIGFHSDLNIKLTKIIE